MYQQSSGKAKYLCSFVQHLFDSQCIENTNPSVGSKCIGGSSQPPFVVKTSERSPRQSGSEDEVKRPNQWQSMPNRNFFLWDSNWVSEIGPPVWVLFGERSIFDLVSHHKWQKGNFYRVIASGTLWWQFLTYLTSFKNLTIFDKHMTLCNFLI